MALDYLAFSQNTTLVHSIDIMLIDQRGTKNGNDIGGLGKNGFRGWKVNPVNTKGSPVSNVIRDLVVWVVLGYSLQSRRSGTFYH